MNGTELVAPLRLMLLGGFALVRNSEHLDLPMSAQRLVALLALCDKPLSRTRLAGILWPDYSAERSLADLRTALWRANHSHISVVVAAGMALGLHPEIYVDVRALLAFGRAYAARSERSAIVGLSGISLSDLSQDLLPDWHDDWLVDDRESVRHLRLHALERLAEEFSRVGRHAEAVQAALAAVRIEPLRETAHATLIRAHLAEGNRSEAVRQLNRCRTLLLGELGVEPSEAIRSLISVPAVLRSP